MAKISPGKCPSIIEKLSRLKGHGIAVSIEKLKEIYELGDNEKIIIALTSLPGVTVKDGFVIIPVKYISVI